MRRSQSNALIGNMSYTNLAAMAEGFENYSRVLPANAQSTSADEASVEGLYAEAMEFINTGLKMDQNSPLEAVTYYQKGGDALSRALESAPPGEMSSKMQYTLNMVEGRVRDITRGVMGRASSDSQVRADAESRAQPRVCAPVGALAVLARSRVSERCYRCRCMH